MEDVPTAPLAEPDEFRRALAHALGRGDLTIAEAHGFCYRWETFPAKRMFQLQRVVDIRSREQVAEAVLAEAGVSAGEMTATGVGEMLRATNWLLRGFLERELLVVLSLELGDLVQAERRVQESPMPGPRDPDFYRHAAIRFTAQRETWVAIASMSSEARGRRPVRTLRRQPPQRRAAASRSARPTRRRTTSSRSPDDPGPGDNPPPRRPLASRGEADHSGHQTKFQRALVAALELNQAELAVLGDHIRVRLVWIGRWAV